MFNDIFGIYTSWFHKDTVSKCKLDPSCPSIFLVFFLFFCFFVFSLLWIKCNGLYAVQYFVVKSLRHRCD